MNVHMILIMISDNDGICDDVDPCVGEYDECGDVMVMEYQMMNVIVKVMY